MRTLLIRPIVALFAVLTGAASLSAQGNVPTRRLPAPDVAFTHELTSVTGVRELADGRAIVVDSRERLVLLFDPRTRSATRISRDGAGPLEYARPSQLLALGRDSSLVNDAGNNRILVLGGDGQPVGTMPDFEMRPSDNVTYGLSVRALDSRGRSYFDLPRGLITEPEKGTPILRLGRGANAKADTLGYVVDFLPVPMRPVGQGAARMGTVAAAPFPTRDDWAVAPDGRLAIVRSDPYRVEWHVEGAAPLSGPVIQYERVRVDAAEKAAWLAAARARGGATMTTTDASGRTTTQRLPVPEPETWPAMKPPFVAPAARIAPDGRLWVRRELAISATESVYDVFDRAGRLVERIAMPAATRVVGFGARHVYTVRRDADDLLFLARHAY